MNPTILLTFDVEDWFQVENFKKYIPFSSWPNCELRVEKNVHKILDLLDSIKLNNSSNPSNPINPSNSINPSNPINSSNPTNPIDSINSTTPSASRLPPNALNSSLCAMPHAPCGTLKATFFVLGWLAERLPHLVREIQTRGHEVASHGYSHRLCKEQSVDELRVDLAKSKELLEDITGNPVYGYRAPSFSIDQNILSLVERAGYLYDSSFNSFRLNKRYGQIDLNGDNGNGMLHKISDSFYEFPITNLRIGKQTIPWGGGGYFRLIPEQLFKYGVQLILRNQGAYLFYLHPWELDCDQPKVTGLRFSYKIRHYINLKKTLTKLSYLLENLRGYSFQTCYQYLKSHEAYENTTAS
jgi:polysaccharide deacetylase family protein (PEP-CTERM system associated)